MNVWLYSCCALPGLVMLVWWWVSVIRDYPWEGNKWYG